jgi:predicted nucleic acid-binding protein
MKSPLCVDASLILWTLVPAPLSDKAEALLDKWHTEQVPLVAPALFAFEVTSTLRRLVYLEEITLTEGEEAFARFQRINIRLSHRRGIYPLAWRLAKQFNRPRAYDTAYLALAKLLGCEFWTADERLYNTVSHELDWVHWIGNYDGDTRREKD